MIKRHKKASRPMMRRACRVFLNDINPGKADTLTDFLRLCRDVTQYFVDLFWQRGEVSAKLADLETVHRARERFGITTRLAQALAKQAKEIIRSAKAKGRTRKPKVRRHTVTLYYHFVKIEAFNGAGFDWAVEFIGSGAPRLSVPIKSTALINRRLADGWIMSKTIRLGRCGHRLWIDLMLEKPRPEPCAEGAVVGMDSNYKAGYVFSDGQQVGQELYERIQGFAKRQKNTHAELLSLTGQALKKVDFSGIKTLVIEDLKRVKHNKRGTFSQVLNRRLSHWLYRASTALLERRCEELGIRLERKDPYKTSQFCRQCRTWDRRNRNSDRFKCVHCGFTDHADRNAAKNLELLGLAGAYGLRSLSN